MQWRYWKYQSVAMPVMPSWESEISACQCRNCVSLEELWFVWVRQANRRAVESETPSMPQGTLILFKPFLGIWNLDPCFFFHHLVPNVRPSTWDLENFSGLLWKQRYSEEGDLPKPFTGSFSLKPVLHESEHPKLMTWLFINLLLAVSCRQTLPWEGIYKS